MRVKIAHNPILWYLRSTDYWAITMPWGVVYVVPEHLDNKELLAHEQIHLNQLTKMGPWKYTLAYLWYLIIHGYENHPMEIEARQKSGFK